MGEKVWIRDLMSGTPADVIVWDQCGPSRTHGRFFDFEVGAHDGTYKGRLHTVGLMCLSLCGHRRRQPLRRRKMMTPFAANCVATILVIYLRVALAT